MSDINKILAKAREAKPSQRLLSKEELEIAIAKKQINPSIKGTIMKISAIFIPLLAIYFWAFSNARTTKPNQEKAIENIKSLENAIDLSGDAEYKRLIPILHLTESELKEIGITYSPSDSAYIYDYETYYNGNMLSSEKKKLKKLGYELDRDEIIRYQGIVGLGIDEEFERKTYSKSEFESSKLKGIGPLQVNIKAIKLDKNRQDTTIRLSSVSSCGYPPSIKRNDSDELSNDLNDFHQEIFFNNNIFKNDFIIIDSKKYDALSQIIIVELPFNSPDLDLYVTQSVAYFVPTPKLLEKLPARYQSIIKQNYEIVDVLDLDDVDYEERVTIDKLKLDRSISLQGINLITLEKDELNSINIDIDSDKVILKDLQEVDIDNDPNKEKVKMLIEILNRNNLDTNMRKGYLVTDLYIGHSNSSNGPMTKNVDWVSQPINTPIYISATTYIMDEGVIKNQSRSYRWQDNNPFLKDDSSSIKAFSDLVDNYNKLGKNEMSDIIYSLDKEGKPIIKSLLPVRINLGDKSNLKEGDNYTEITLWYVPTPEFINGLPPRFSEPLRREFDLIASVEAGDITIGDACEALEGTSYFGICPSGDFALMNLYPQPAITNLELLIVSEKTTKLNIEVYDLNGNFISEFNKKDIIGGKNNISLNVGNLQSGTYALSLESEDGSRINKMFLKK